MIAENRFCKRELETSSKPSEKNISKNKEFKIWKIPVTWKAYGIMNVKSKTIEEALSLIKDVDRIYPEIDGYVDFSIEPSTKNPEEIMTYQ